MNRYTVFAGALALAGCTASQQQQASNVIVAGQLYCKQASATAPLVVAIATTAGVPVSVIGKTADEVTAICALINATPVPPPPAPAAAPVAKIAPTA